MDAPNKMSGTSSNQGQRLPEDAANADLLKHKRMMNRMYAQRCYYKKQERIEKLQIVEEELKERIAFSRSQIASYHAQMAVLACENAELKRKIAVLHAQAQAADAELESLKLEKRMLTKYLESIHPTPGNGNDSNNGL